jgi:hypothetical protein
LSFDAQTRLETNVSRFYRAIEESLEKAGGQDWLCARLDQRPSYQGTISKCLNRVEENGQRKFPADWLVAIAEEPEAAAVLIHALAEVAHVDVQVSARIEVDPTEQGKAAIEALRDLQRAGVAVGDALNRKLGVRPGTVRL